MSSIPVQPVPGARGGGCSSWFPGAGRSPGTGLAEKPSGTVWALCGNGSQRRGKLGRGLGTKGGLRGGWKRPACGGPGFPGRPKARHPGQPAFVEELSSALTAPGTCAVFHSHPGVGYRSRSGTQSPIASPRGRRPRYKGKTLVAGGGCPFDQDDSLKLRSGPPAEVVVSCLMSG